MRTMHAVLAVGLILGSHGVRAADPPVPGLPASPFFPDLRGAANPDGPARPLAKLASAEPGTPPLATMLPAHLNPAPRGPEPGVPVRASHPWATHGPIPEFRTGDAYLDGDDVFPFTLDPQVGFIYAQPFWTGKFPTVLPNPEDQNYSVSFVPRFDLAVNFRDVSAKVAGYHFPLAGKLHRDFETGAGVGSLDADTRVTLTSITLAELAFPGDRPSFVALRRREHNLSNAPPAWWQVGVGVQYAAISQEYTALTASGSNPIARYHATARFDGPGATVALRGGYDFTPYKVWVFGRARGSVLLGTLDRYSLFAAAPAAPVIVKENEQELIPVAELEIGIGLGDKSYQQSSTKNPVIWQVRASAVAQYWGEVGLSSATAAGATQLPKSHFSMVGALVVFEVRLGASTPTTYARLDTDSTDPGSFWHAGPFRACP